MSNRNKKLLWQIPFLIILIIASIIIVKQQKEAPYQYNEGFIFGTTYHIKYQYTEDLQNEIVDELNKVDNSLSTFNKSSITSKINTNRATKLDEMFIEVFDKAQSISAKTNGAFDITVAPLVNVWGFGFKQYKSPSTSVIDSLKEFVGYKKVNRNNFTIHKSDKRIMLDFSAIAKGYGVDIVARFLKDKGINNYMIEIGGEIIVHGNNQNRLPWNIGINKPIDIKGKNTEIQTVLNITNIAMATSGNYRNFYYKGGKKYAHTIDPKTGYPVQHSLLSSTVLANDCATADAYATSFMVMGITKAKEILKKNSKLLAYFIYCNQKGELKEWYSPELRKKIVY